MSTLQEGLAQLRQRAKSAVEPPHGDCVDLVAPVYEAAIYEALASVEHRVVNEMWTVDGWKEMHSVPLASHEEQMLSQIKRAADARQRPLNPKIGEYGRSWVESRAVTEWSRGSNRELRK